ncbi:Uncharacterized protein PECH_007089 [Penicillium ucsense]|uniref:Protein HRI1 n=1 Tax=Penicillium ucsense TaxID=2839758 RepID=A0A8J8VVP3_9EURO|nr:Uncharacterized protein PECM_003651 [Penicillium ucsense]KAF7735202.1 Uncharacterized protein PECH_007089 [Penicillium ucsense]
MANTGNPTTSICRYSTRVSLRWLPEPAHETTDTIVMSVQDWYLDLRIDKKTGDIDWAIAGQRVVESEEPLRVTFTHEIDSHNAFDSVDCGTFVTLPNGDDLETGSMPRPDLPGAPETEYEEVWRELPFRPGPEGADKGISWVLESDDGSLEEEGDFTVTKTFLGRLWGTYLALQQTQLHSRRRTPSGEWIVKKSGTHVSARREEWDSDWQDRYVVGSTGDNLPSMRSGFDSGSQQSWSKPGEKVMIQGRSYVVRAFEEMK